MTEPTTKSVDNRIHDWTIRHWNQHLWLDAFFMAAGRWTPITMLCVIVISTTGFGSPWTGTAERMLPAIISILSAILVRMINEPLTRFAKRPRPFETSLAIPLLSHDEGGSFPSNHAAGAFALAFGFFGLSPYFPLLLVLAVLLSTARVYTGLHYLTDVIAGAINGTVVAIIVAAIVNIVH